jgi:cysteine synthase A
MALAFVCAAAGYRGTLVCSDAFSKERLTAMAAFGAEVLIVPSDRQRFTEGLFREMIATAQRLASEPETYWTDQLNNRDGAVAYHPLGEEIWRQTGGRVAAFVQSVVTAHSLHGTADVLRDHRPGVRIVAVEPAESPFLSTGRSGSHRIEGIGIGFTPPLWRPDQVNDVLSVAARCHDDGTKTGGRGGAARGHVDGSECDCRPSGGGGSPGG